MSFKINTNCEHFGYCELCGGLASDWNKDLCKLCEKTIKDAREQKEYLEKLKKGSAQ